MVGRATVLGAKEVRMSEQEKSQIEEQEQEEGMEDLEPSTEQAEDIRGGSGGDRPTESISMN
jgi:hypothetical protein